MTSQEFCIQLTDILKQAGLESPEVGELNETAFPKVLRAVETLRRRDELARIWATALEAASWGEDEKMWSIANTAQASYRNAIKEKP